MRVAMLYQSWPGLNGPVGLDGWWASASPASLEWARIGDGGPLSVSHVPGDRSVVVPGVAAVTIGAETWLEPVAGAWNPLELAEALDRLARGVQVGGGRTHIVVPVGDAECAGDPRDMWVGHETAPASRWAPLSIDVLVTSTKPLLGLGGMSAAAMDLDPSADAREASQVREASWSRFAAWADPQAAPVLVGPRRLSDTPGAGAASGLAYCLAAGGARIVQAMPRLAEQAGFDKACAGAALAIAIVDVLDHRGLDVGLPRAVVDVAARHGVPAVVLAGESRVGRRDLMAAGLASAHEAGGGLDGLRDGLRRLADTWLRAPQN